MRVSRAVSTPAVVGPMLAAMPIVDLARTQPVAARSEIERERAALSRALAVRWPRAARDVLLIGAQVDRHNRRCRALGLPQLAAAEPLAAAGALWAVLSASDAGGRRVGR